MTEPMPMKKRGHLGVLMLTVATVLVISPAYLVGYFVSRGKVNASLVALPALAMFLVGAFLIMKLLKE